MRKKMEAKDAAKFEQREVLFEGGRQGGRRWKEEVAEVLGILHRNISPHSLRYGGAVFTITSFEQIAEEIYQLFEPKHLGKAEFRTAFADELLEEFEEGQLDGVK